MDSVNHFNAELSSLYDVKPPISKGKMTSITKAAMKAVKLYKHVVQSVEKFIQKCKPEYKIPGLYVIDSIIRQSRHQYGGEKDIFAGRFLRNLQTTFVYLYKCPDEDKSKIIRVLNLWQKNGIFLPEAIQPLFDLADPNNPIWETVNAINPGQDSGGNDSSYPSLPNQSNDQHPVHFKKELLDYDYDEEDEMGGGDGRSSSNHPHPHPVPPPPQLSQVPNHNEMTQNALSGFDALGSILTNPEVLRQLQTLQEQMAAAAAQQHQLGYLTPEQERQRKLAELNKQEAAFDQRLAQTVARLPFAVECDLPFADNAENRRSPKTDMNSGVDQNSNHQNTGLLLPPPFFHQLNPEHLQQMLPPANDAHHQNMNMLDNPPPLPNPFGIPLNFSMHNAPPMHFQHTQQPPTLPQQNPNQYNHMQENPLGFPVHFKPDQPPPFDQMDSTPEVIRDDYRDRERRDRGNRPERERRNRSRSRSGSETQRRRSRSTSRTRNRKRHIRSRSRDRKEDKEREKERHRKGLPGIKKGHLSVCSTTLWVGHLSKLVSQEELSDTFGAYGDVVSIDLISPRGCAFVVMNRRQDACRALDRLKNSKLQGKTITLAWAPGKGVKGRDWKDYWEVEAGVSYIPWPKLKVDTNLEEFEDGGSIDEDSLPEMLKQQYKAITSKEERKEDDEKMGNNEVNEDTKPNPIHSAPLLKNAQPGLATPEKVNPGDIDIRLPDAAAPTPVPGPGIGQVVPTSLVSPFGLGHPGGLMNVQSMAMNMMIPPPMMGSSLLMQPQFQGMNSMANMNLSMMGMLPPNMGPRMPHDPNPMQALSAGNGREGILGEMPMLHQPPQLQHTNNIQEFPDRLAEDNRKRRPDDRRENREKKRSRFEDADDRSSPHRDILDRHSPPAFERVKDGQPLFERLKNMAGGYGFSGQGNNDKMTMANSLLGAPIGPAGPRGLMDARMTEPPGFPPLPPRGHAGQFAHVRGPSPFSGERETGPGTGGSRPWFDGTQNPFIHQNSQNPFAGNPFIQQGNPTKENPFDIGGPGRGGGGDRGRGHFFGGSEPPNHFPPRGGGGGRGWPRGDGPNNWRGQTRGRGVGPGHAIGRGGQNWRNRNQDFQDEEADPRDLDRDRDNRGFRGGRGRDRSNDFDRDSDRRRGWERGGNGRDRDIRDPPNRDRERDRDFRGRDRGRERDPDTAYPRDSKRKQSTEYCPAEEPLPMGPDVKDENWDAEPTRPAVNHEKPVSQSIPDEENWITENDKCEDSNNEYVKPVPQLIPEEENWITENDKCEDSNNEYVKPVPQLIPEEENWSTENDKCEDSNNEYVKPVPQLIPEEENWSTENDKCEDSNNEYVKPVPQLIPEEENWITESDKCEDSNNEYVKPVPQLIPEEENWITESDKCNVPNTEPAKPVSQFLPDVVLDFQ